MKCVICKHGETQIGKTTITLERNATTIVFKNVPAEVCNNCGESYINEKTTDTLLRTIENAVEAGIQVSIRSYPTS